MIEPNVVAFGGGTGMGTLLRGLKHLAGSVTAIVTMADDGGSSGRLRQHLDVAPPGDVRNCLVALAGDEPLLAELFQFRFRAGALKGHNFGNLFLSALTKLTGDLGQAIEVANRVLRVEGRVLPCTTRKVTLVAEHDDGTKTTGESKIGRSGRPIRRVELKPSPGRVSDEIRDTIAAADIVAFGPGSLYTSVIPTLLVGGMQEALAASPALRAFVVNVMTQPGETDGYTVEDHVRAFREHAPAVRLDAAFVNSGRIPDRALEDYRREGQAPVVTRGRPEDLDVDEVIETNLVCTTTHVRHNPERLARALVDWWQRRRGDDGTGEP